MRTGRFGKWSKRRSSVAEVANTIKVVKQEAVVSALTAPKLVWQK